jgi:hypothetical protein
VYNNILNCKGVNGGNKMSYIKTRFRLQIKPDKKYNRKELIDYFEKEIPLIWLDKQYNKTLKIKQNNPAFIFKNCKCVEIGKCKVVYMSEPFFNWLRLNFKKYRKIWY